MPFLKGASGQWLASGGRWGTRSHSPQKALTPPLLPNPAVFSAYLV
jgi:hypothetical protein